jgi:hypothetical protein
VCVYRVATVAGMGRLVDVAVFKVYTGVAWSAEVGCLVMRIARMCLASARLEIGFGDPGVEHESLCLFRVMPCMLVSGSVHR